MKLSLSWILDHIDGIAYDQVDITALAEQFNQSVAEISSFESWQLPEHLEIGRVQAMQADQVTIAVTDMEAVSLPYRADAAKKTCFFIMKLEFGWRWATLKDMGCSKEGLLPPVYVSPKEHTTWKKKIEQRDWILDIDNKSITHRADLWSHRGMAREIARILGKSLVSEKKLFKKITTHETDANTYRATTEFPFSLEISAPDYCSRFGMVYMPSVTNRATSAWMTVRLARLEHKPIDALVDATNYVMLDIGQPIHAFDAARITGETIKVRLAHAAETIELLDRTTISLRAKDLVVADAHHALSLAGVMGGEQTAVKKNTAALLVESATFDAAIIRKAALLHKKRTESSVRFEKTLDPVTSSDALYRYYALLKKEKLIKKNDHAYVVICGKSPEPVQLSIAHTDVEKIVGVAVDKNAFISLLKPLGFTMHVTRLKGDLLYRVHIPSWRARKDIRIPVDIVEEFVRIWGFKKIPQVPAQRAMRTQLFDQQYDFIFNLKMATAYGMGFQEVQNYAVYDEQFLKKLEWAPVDTVLIANPMSEYATCLVSSLIPHLLKNVIANKIGNTQVRFFELNKVWQAHDVQISEKRMLTGVWWYEQGCDFYRAKECLNTVFASVHVQPQWSKTTDRPWWMHPYQGAMIVVNDKTVGYAGMVHPIYLQRLGLSGELFAFECNIDVLQHMVQPIRRYIPAPKYPSSSFDISCFVTLSVSVHEIEQFVAGLDARIVQVHLVDFFEKEEWHDKRSITVRVLVQDAHKTLQKADIDTIQTTVIESLKARFHVQIR